MQRHNLQSFWACRNNIQLLEVESEVCHMVSTSRNVFLKTLVRPLYMLLYDLIDTGKTGNTWMRARGWALLKDGLICKRGKSLSLHGPPRYNVPLSMLVCILCQLYSVADKKIRATTIHVTAASHMDSVLTSSSNLFLFPLSIVNRLPDHSPLTFDETYLPACRFQSESRPIQQHGAFCHFIGHKEIYRWMQMWSRQTPWMSWLSSCCFRSWWLACLQLLTIPLWVDILMVSKFQPSRDTYMALPCLHTTWEWYTAGWTMSMICKYLLNCYLSPYEPAGLKGTILSYFKTHGFLSHP